MTDSPIANSPTADSLITALIPGSFDPLTNGHLDIIRRSMAIFPNITIGIVINPHKKGLLTIAERHQIISQVLADEFPNRKPGIVTVSGLLVAYAKDHNIDVVIKGLRSSSDFAYELPMDHMNAHLTGLHTVYLATAPQWDYVSSSLVKEVASLGGDISALIPRPALLAMQEKYSLPN